MTVTEVIEAFVDGATTGRASMCSVYPNGRLYIQGNELINYYTTIAYRKGCKFYVNTDWYSKTTSKHQNRLKRLLGNNYISCTEDELYAIINSWD